MCALDKYDTEVDVSPHVFADHRRAYWPSPSPCDTTNNDIIHIYSAVRSMGLPNSMGARIPVPSALPIHAWESYSTHTDEDRQLLEFIQYGFPLGYLGPVSDTTDVPNHDSATNFPSFIDTFVQEEMQHGAFMGPFTRVPFTPWAHVSPLMSRPKSDPAKRRVSTDLTFPQDRSVNAYIMKNSALGIVRDHTLPTVADIVSLLQHHGPGSVMFTVDIARAYRNFRSDPIDWPLLCVAWKGAYYVDTSMPFGARASSCHMQRAADFIVRALRREGIEGAMYLDDLIIVAPDHTTATQQYHRVRSLLAELGLPEAEDKAQPPSTCVTWLGMNIDSCEMTLSIPQSKVADILQYVQRCKVTRSLHKRQLQSLIGKLMHLAKCVLPARVFMARLIEALRDMKTSWYTRVTATMRADLEWFSQFAATWNGRAVIPQTAPHRRIQVDACLTGVGATDGSIAHAGMIAPDDDPVNNITEIEAANVVIALHTFITELDRGKHVEVECDNMSTVQALTHGRARNPV